jgi:ribosomal protein S18 acetylase RimI-like enzyme
MAVMSDPVIALRPARAADRDFLWSVQWRGLGRYVTAVFGTDEVQQRAFFDEHHDPARSQVVVVDGVDAGVLAWWPRDDHWYLGTIGLLPDFQGRGIGGRLIGRLLADADTAGVPVRLQVLRSNDRARVLYERLGFRVAGATATHHQMERRPGGHPQPASRGDGGRP